MKKLNKWIAKNKVLSIILLSLSLCGIYSCFFYMLKMQLWIIIVFNILLILVNYCYVSSINNNILKEPIKQLNEGDPLPLFKETEELLTYKNSQANKQILLINHSLALREMGKLQKAYDILNSINIDKSSGTLPYIKAVYYNNLSDICDLLNDSEKADIWFNKMMQIYNDMPENKAKKSLQNSVSASKAADHLRKGNYEQAIAVLNEIQTNDLRLKTELALLYAKASLKLNDTKTAEEKLNFVIANGNKLYAVTQAEQLMRSITMI